MLLRYKFKNLNQVREKYRKAIEEGKPLLICPNHLTMADSLIIHHFLGSNLWYMFHYQNFSWNVPAVENFKSTFWLSVMTYLGKCIPINRKGGKKHTDLVLNQIKFFLNRNEPFTVFLEGGRSRTGKIEVDNVTYGVGNIYQAVEDCSVLCIYLRGKHQNVFSYIPKKGDEFTMELELFKPKTNLEGVRGEKDISIQIIKKLKEMEDRYFNQNG